MSLQDAQEFFLHLLSSIDKNQRLSVPNSNPVDAFRFQFEDRVECGGSGSVRYSKRDDFLLQLPVPMDLATNQGIEPCPLPHPLDDHCQMLTAQVEAWQEKKRELEANKQRM